MGLFGFKKRPDLRWSVHSSAEQRSGRYTIIHDWTDTEVRVTVDGEMLSPGFGTVADAKAWCERHHRGTVADAAMIASARALTGPEDDADE